MRPKTNETKENVIDSSNLVSGSSYISYNSDAERIRGGTDDDYDYEADENDSDSNANNMNTQLIHDFRDQITTFSDEVINRCFHLQDKLIFLRRKVERRKEDELA